MTQIDVNINIKERGGKGAERAIDGIDKSSRRAHTGVERLNRVLGAVGVGSGVAALTALTDRYTNLTRAVSRFETPMRTSQQLLREMADVARSTSSSLDATVTGYSRLRVAGKNLGIGHNRLKRILELTNKTIQISGASAQEAQAGMIQFNQALASGRLQGDEFRSLMENVPVLMQNIAKGIGVPIGQLREMSREGALTAEVVIGALEKMGTSIDKEFAKMGRGPRQALQDLSTTATITFGEIATATGVIQGVTAAIDGLRGNLSGAIGVVTALSLAVGTRLVAGFFAARAAAVGFTGSLLTMSGTAATLRGVLAFLGGPIGIAIAGLGLAFGTMVASAGRAQESVAGLGQALQAYGSVALAVKGYTDQLNASLEGLTAQRREFTINQELRKARGEVTNVLGEFTRLRNSLMGLWSSSGERELAKMISDFKSGHRSTDQLRQGLMQLANTDPGLSDKINAAIEMADKYDLARGKVEAVGEAINNLPAQKNIQIRVSAAFDASAQAAMNMMGQGVPGMGGTNEFVSGDRVLAGSTLMPTASSSVGTGGGIQQQLTELEKLGQAYQALNAPLQQFQTAQQSLTTALKNGSLNTDQYNTKLDQLKTAGKNAGLSFKQMAADAKTAGSEIARSMAQVAGNAVQGLADQFVELAFTGKANFADLAKNIIKQLVKIMVQALIVKPLLGFLGFSNGGAFSSGAQMFAKGGAFAGGAQMFATGGTFTNSVVNSPTPFRFANGGVPSLGVMGEAGPEAILPLKRGRGGNLGVEASGLGGKSDAPIINLSIENYGSDKEFEVDQVSRDEVRVIASDVVRNEAPFVIASDIANPNSKTSKALSSHTNTTRKR